MIRGKKMLDHSLVTNYGEWKITVYRQYSEDPHDSFKVLISERVRIEFEDRIVGDLIGVSKWARKKRPKA